MNSKVKEKGEPEDFAIQLEALKYLTDRAYGKARQAIEAVQGTEVQFVVKSILEKP